MPRDKQIKDKEQRLLTIHNNTIFITLMDIQLRQHLKALSIKPLPKRGR